MYTVSDGTTKEPIHADFNQSLDPTPIPPALEARLDEIQAILRQMLALAEESAGQDRPDLDREALQAELDRLRDEIDSIADQIYAQAGNPQ